MIEKKITKNKSIVIELDKYCRPRIFNFVVRITSKKWDDHAGIFLELEIHGWFILFNLYDIRHSDANEVLEKYEKDNM